MRSIREMIGTCWTERPWGIPMRAWVQALIMGALLGWFFVAPGLHMVEVIRDDATSGPGIPASSWRLHRSLTPRMEAWANERVREEGGAHVAVLDVPSTEWPTFSSVFYLQATEQLQAAWEQGVENDRPAPAQYARGAIRASRDLLMDPANHTWVKKHWGENYLHRENVFFRSLLIAGLTSYVTLTGDRTDEPFLRDQVETLSADLDQSPRGLLDDYPGECYPIDIVAAIGYIQRADRVLGTNHDAFVQRSLRAFTGPMDDDLGLVPFRTDLPSYEQVQPSRGIGNSWTLAFAPDLWPEQGALWYAKHEQWFWQRRAWAEGFREFAKTRGDLEWQVEVDAGPVLDGFGTSASGFGVAAARRNGRFDHAYTLSTQAAAVSWVLPDGTALLPRILSHAAAAPYLGESALLAFQTMQPAPGVPIVKGGRLSPLVYFGLLVSFGIPSLAALAWWLRWRRERLVKTKPRRASSGEAQVDCGEPVEETREGSRIDAV